MGERETPNVLSIPAELPFLPTLASFLLENTLTLKPGEEPDPFSLTDTVVYLPTRRAARALSVAMREAFKKHTGRNAVVLPRIRTLGDGDDEEALLSLPALINDSEGFLNGGEDAIDDTAIVATERRRAELSNLINRWATLLNQQENGVFGEERIVLPASPADALRLADTLANFIDRIETEEIDFKLLRQMNGDDFGEWWQHSLKFLDIILTAWPRWLVENGMVDPAIHRRRVAEARMDDLGRNPPRGLVIAAGSTGSIPSTARLLKTIAHLDRGVVILPGLDHSLPVEVETRFRDGPDFAGDEVRSTHPQYGMIQLLKRIGLRIADVGRLGDPDAELELRNFHLNNALLPSKESGDWKTLRNDQNFEDLRHALSGLTIMEAANDQEEAVAIAIALRQVVKNETECAVLVTPDRNLARRVAAELERFGIRIDDSAGLPLATAKGALFIKLLLDCTLTPGDPVTLAELIKHQLFRPFEREEASQTGKWRELAELMEIAVLRGQMHAPDIADLESRIRLHQQRLTDEKHPERRIKEMTSDDWDAIARQAKAIREAAAPLLALREGSEDLTLSVLAGAIADAIDRCCFDNGPAGAFLPLSGSPELASILGGHVASETDSFRFPIHEAPAVLEAMLAGATYRKREQSHPRLQIYGQLEARLQTADRIILGGLNEGVWPSASDEDPFLNRQMKSALEMALPERRVGLAAHDFVQLASNRNVILSRSARMADKPAVASRFLQRLQGYLGKDALRPVRERGEFYLDIARRLDRSAPRKALASRPEPKPPTELRPSRLSFTRIETWIRDPYSIHARYILGLEPLQPLQLVADPRLRGILLHAVIADFTEKWSGPIKPEAFPVLRKIISERMEAEKLPVEIATEWQQRFEAIGAQFLAWATPRWSDRQGIFCETHARLPVGNTGFILTGNADRIEIDGDGGATIIDFKSGTPPSGKEARSLSPQLPLEGAAITRGGFKEIGKATPIDLLYVKLQENDGLTEIDVTRGTGKEVLDAKALSERAFSNLEEMVLAYQNPEQGYLSRYAPKKDMEFGGDYDHLARVREWSVGEEDDQGGGS